MNNLYKEIKTDGIDKKYQINEKYQNNSPDLKYNLFKKLTYT